MGFKMFTDKEKSRAVERSKEIGVVASAKEAGASVGSLHLWRKAAKVSRKPKARNAATKTFSLDKGFNIPAATSSKKMFAFVFDRGDIADVLKSLTSLK